MMAFSGAAAVLYAVGVFPQTESFVGAPLAGPHYNADLLLVEHPGAAAP